MDFEDFARTLTVTQQIKKGACQTFLAEPELKTSSGLNCSKPHSKGQSREARSNMDVHLQSSAFLLLQMYFGNKPKKCCVLEHLESEVESAT